MLNDLPEWMFANLPEGVTREDAVKVAAQVIDACKAFEAAGGNPDAVFEQLARALEGDDAGK